MADSRPRPAGGRFARSTESRSTVLRILPALLLVSSMSWLSPVIAAATSQTTSTGLATPTPDSTPEPTATPTDSPSPEPEESDTPIPVLPTDLTVALVAPNSIGPGRAWSYSIVVTDNGSVAVTGALVRAAVPADLGTASWSCTADKGASCGGGTTGEGKAISGSVDLAPGRSATLTVEGVRPTVLPDSMDALDREVTLAADVAPGAGSDGDQADNRASRSVALTGSWLEVRQIEQAGDGGGLSRTQAGSVVVHQVVLRNVGVTDSPSTVVTVDLAGVMDDAGYRNDLTASAGSATFDAVARAVRWSGSVPAGGSATITYSVVTDTAPKGDKALVTEVTSGSLGIGCPTAPEQLPFRSRGCESVVRIDVPSVSAAPTAPDTPIPSPAAAAPSGKGLADEGELLAIGAGAAVALVVVAVGVSVTVSAHRRRRQGLR